MYWLKMLIFREVVFAQRHSEHLGLLGLLLIFVALSTCGNLPRQTFGVWKTCFSYCHRSRLRKAKQVLLNVLALARGFGKHLPKHFLSKF